LASDFTRVEQDKAIRANQVDTTATSFAAKQENEFFPLGVIKLINEFLTLIDSHRSVKSEEAISASKCALACFRRQWLKGELYFFARSIFSNMSSV
jgi:hypothetical protein